MGIMYMDSKYNTPELHLTLIKTLLALVGHILSNNNIKWWAEGGTLLGALRHNDIISWDDDADIGVENKCWKRVLAALQANLKDVSVKIDDASYHVLIDETSTSLIKVYVPDLWAKTIEGDRVIATPTIDIFRYKINNNDIVELESVHARKQFPNSYFKYDELFPIKECDFGKFKIKCPNDGIPYVQRLYGVDCMTKGRIDIRTPNENDHLGKVRESIEFEITPDL